LPTRSTFVDRFTVETYWLEFLSKKPIERAFENPNGITFQVCKRQRIARKLPGCFSGKITIIINIV